jgi:hypothetical protein
MQCLRSVHKGTRNAQALHRCDNLAPYKAALADAADYELAPSLAILSDGFDSLEQAIAGYVVRLVQEGDLGQRSGGGGEDVDST